MSRFRRTIRCCRGCALLHRVSRRAIGYLDSPRGRRRLVLLCGEIALGAGTARRVGGCPCSAEPRSSPSPTSDHAAVAVPRVHRGADQRTPASPGPSGMHGALRSTLFSRIQTIDSTARRRAGCSGLANVTATTSSAWHLHITRWTGRRPTGCSRADRPPPAAAGDADVTV